jgi:hypothetical protein
MTAEVTFMKIGWSGAVWVAGLVTAIACTGCGAAAADLAGKAAVAVLDAALSPSHSSGTGATTTNAGPLDSTSLPSETPCRKKQREWREKEGNPRIEPPVHLRCGPKGDWPDEDDVRATGRPTFG